jgi:tetratricopeptide (TPR) repeat protein
MQEKNILPCFLALPLRHKLVAVVIAVAISSGFFIWSRHSAVLATTAEMLFDTVLAQQINPNLPSTKEPAVALGQSILNDDLIKGLMKRFGIRADIAGFRSRLKTTQQSPKSLNVNYHDGNKELSVVAANAIANLLVGWTPPSVAAAAKSVSTRQATTSAAHPAANSRQDKHPSRSRLSRIRKLEAQLVATEQKLASFSSPPIQSASRKADEPKRTLSVDDEQRHELEMQLNADQKRLDALRVRYTDQYPNVENVKADIAEIRQKLASIRSAGNKEKQPVIPLPPDAGSNDVNQLRLERVRLLQAIAAEKRRHITPQGQATPVGSLGQSPILSQPPSGSVPQPKGPVPSLTLQSPFTLVRLASYNEAVSWWQGLLAGMLCGLLYLTSAVWRYLPIDRSAARNPVFPGVAPVNNFTNFQEWEKEVKQALALTDIGQQKQVLVAREEVVVSQQQLDLGRELKGQLRYDEVSQAIQEKVKEEPNNWMAHTEEARAALAGGDYDTAIKEMNLAITMAPDNLKPKLERIIMHLDRNVSHS